MSLASIRRPSRLLALALANALPVMLAAALPAAAAEADVISILVDRAKVMHISRPADIVIIGNPAIADATIQDNQTLIITGKSFGTTNLIVLDAAGQAIAEDTLTVAASEDNVVTVYRRASRVTFSCTPACSPTLALGDVAETYDAVNAQVMAHNALAGPSNK